jgi:hypothetical protein
MKPIKIYQETFDMMKPPLKALCKKLKKWSKTLFL